MDLKVKKLVPDAELPEYATEGAACFDIKAYVPGIFREKDIKVTKHNPIRFSTGLAFEIPEGWAMLLFSRSGHGFSKDTRLANCVGVIDSDYRGELNVKLTCDQHESQLVVKHGDRIAQAMLVPVEKVNFIETFELGETARGEGGLGSTGQ